MNIKIFLIFFSLIFSNVLLAEHAGFQSENNREISWGKLRWFLPADRWSIAEQFVRKGKFFSISMTSNDDLPVKIFGSPSRNGRPDFIFTGAIRFPGSDFFCKRTPSLNNSIAKKFAECSLFFCFERTGEKVIPLIPPDLDNTWERFNLRTAEDLGPCPVHLNYYDQISLNDERKNELRFGFIDINEKEKFLNIEVNGFRKYLDISFCRNLSDSGRLHCNIVNIERSILEEQILEMERVKKNKSIIALNDLITNLLPCVKKRTKTVSSHISFRSLI